MDADRRAVVEAYWRHWVLGEGDRAARLRAERESDWAGDMVYDAVWGPAPFVVDLLVDLAHAAPTPEHRGLIGAGPLEELLVHHGEAVLDEVVVAARRDRVFRAELQAAYLDESLPDIVLERLRPLAAVPRPPAGGSATG